MTKTYITGKYFMDEIQKIVKENEKKYPELKKDFFKGNIFRVFMFLSGYQNKTTPQETFDDFIKLFQEKKISL